MNYIGSKVSLLPFIKEAIYNVASRNLIDKVFCDLFAGTGSVSRSFKKEVKTIIANDFEYYSYVLLKNYIKNNLPIIKKPTIKDWNMIEPIEGFIYNNYSLSAGRSYFTDYNAGKIDAIRVEIERYTSTNLYYYLLCSLLENADKVANTASVYGAFLKKFKKQALKNIEFVYSQFEITNGTHFVYNMKANKLIRRIKGDILYLDPPYNHRQYGSNYHLLNTIAKYKEFQPKGKTGLPEYNKSLYCRKNESLLVFDDLIKNAKFRFIFLSYNNEGVMPIKIIAEIMKKYGKYSFTSTTYKRYKADNDRKYTSNETKEFLHILVKE